MSIFNFVKNTGGAAAAGLGGRLGAGLGIAGINGLLNLLGGNAEAGRMDDLRAELMRLFSGQNLVGQTSQLFGGIQRSPMYSALRGGAMEGATQLGNMLQSSYARAGLGRSGIAAAAVPLARASTLGNFQNIDAELFMKAMNMASDLIGNQANALYKTSTPRGWQIGAGNTLQSLQPLMLAYFMSRMPQQGGSSGGQS